MTASKSRAYIAPTGKQYVSAWAIAKERDERYLGRPTGETYYSLHPEGRRKPLSHVYRRGTYPFFRYINSSDEHDAGPGESLEHSLFKEAVAAITHTRLSLGKFGDYRIRVVHAETEKKILYEGGEFSADVYLQFESDTDLGMKWGGELYVEIHKTHLVDAAKMDEINRLRVPMIEVSIPQQLLYEFGDEGTTDEREEAYRLRIKRMLESEKGYLGAIVLSDPSSVEYMERQLAAAQIAAHAAETKAKAASDEFARTRAEQLRLSNQLTTELVASTALRSELAVAARLVSSKTGLVHELESKLKAARESIDLLSQKLRNRRIALWATGCTIAVVVLYWAFNVTSAASDNSVVLLDEHATSGSQ